MAEPWIRVHANLVSKPVVYRLGDALHVSRHEAIGLLVEFWGAVSQYATDGKVGGFPDSQLEGWAGWERKPRGAFAAFIRSTHLDPQGRVNEWDDYAGKLELRRATERERLRNKRAAVAQHPTSNTPNNGLHVAQQSATVAQPLLNEGEMLEPARAVRNETIRITTRASTPTAREALSDSAVALTDRLADGVDRAALGALLALVPSPVTWVAELTASLDGMTGHVMATPAQLGEAIRDFLGNGAGEAPSLRRLRRYIESAVHPGYVSPYRTPGPTTKGGGARNDAALDALDALDAQDEV